MATPLRRKMWQKRKAGVRRRLRRSERPLLTVYRSSKHIYASLTDPMTGRTLTTVSTRTPAVREGLKATGNREAAKRVGAAIAAAARDRDIEQVTFNRNGFTFTGRVQAVADGAREAGLKI